MARIKIEDLPGDMSLSGQEMAKIRGGALNMAAVFDKLDQIQGTESDPTNPDDILKMQQMMQKWTIATQLQSNTLKTMGDGIKSTIQNIR